MAAATGTVTSLWRYPVKSMGGETLQAAELGEYGLLGDRSYALIDDADGKVATAKNPSKWPTLFGFRASFVDRPQRGTARAAVRITLPDGSTVASSAGECNQTLSRILNRAVTLAAAQEGRVTGVHRSLPAAWTGKAEEYWPDMDGLDHRDTVTDFALPAGTFFDGATIHLLTSATLTRLHDSYPQGRFEVPRFRPNIMLEMSSGEGFIEETWTGQTLAIGKEVRLKITGPCGRCVMTTLAQGDLPKDNGILRTAVERNRGHVGVYAAVVQGGTIMCGDALKVSG